MNILFLCAGNSCRSQLAEGWAKQFAPFDWVIESAGIEAHGKNSRAIAVMHEAGIDISGQESTRVDDAMINAASVVVTVCGDADENCPVLPPSTRKEHWPLNDPANATGTEEQIMAVFRTTRDEIRRRTQKLIENLVQENQQQIVA